jgi:hypothetical protein
MFLNVLSYISYAYIIAYGCAPFLLDQSKLTLKFKIITSIFIGVSVAITIIKQEIDKKKEKQLREEEHFDRQEIKSGVNILTKQQRIEKIEERENLKTTQDYLRYGMMQIDDINHNLRIIARNSSIYHNFLLLYFEQIEKIPHFFNQNEWEDSESSIYNSMVNRLNGYFNLGGAFRSSVREKELEALQKEREKLLIAKRREFTNKK